MMQVDGVSVPAEHINQSVTRVVFQDETIDPDFTAHTLSTQNDRVLSMIAKNLGSSRRYAVAVNELEQILAVHSGGAPPRWVSVLVPEDGSPEAEGFDATAASELEKAIASFYEGCTIGEPVALLTTVGRDALHSQHMNTAAQPASFNFMAVSANVTAPSAASTTLPGEITTAGGGLLRAQATYAHTASTNVTTLTKTFTANGSDSLPVTVAKIGILNASSVGTLGYETLLNATATLTTSGDNVAITESVTAG